MTGKKAVLGPIHRRTSTKVTISVALVVCLLVVGVLWFSARTTQAALRDAEEQNLAQVGTLLSDSSVAALALGESELLQDNLSTIAPLMPGLQYVTIHALDGKELARWEKSPGLVLSLDHATGEHNAHLQQSIHDLEGAVIGTLNIAMSREILKATLGTFRFVVLATLALTAVVVVFLAFFLGRYQMGLEERVALRTADLQASMARLEDLYNSRDRTFKKLGELSREALVPLHEQLTHRSLASDRKAQENAQKMLGALLDDLAPLTAQFQAQAQLRDKRVLLAASVPKLQRAVRVALMGTGVQLDTPEDHRSFAALLESTSYDVVCADAEHLALAMKAVERNPRVCIVLITAEGISSVIPILRDYAAITNMVAYDLDNMARTISGMLTTVSKILNRDLFGLEKYLSWGVDVEERHVHRSDARAEVQKQMAEHLHRVGIRKRIIDAALSASEEMLMNALYDAPVDGSGKSLFNHMSRTDVVELPPNHKVRVRYACDGLVLAVSVEDPYGSLERNTIVEYLETNYDDRPGASKRLGKGGAGRGLFMLTEASDLVVFNVARGVRTEVIALFYLNQDARKSAAPMFHYFSS